MNSTILLSFSLISLHILRISSFHSGITSRSLKTFRRDLIQRIYKYVFSVYFCVFLNMYFQCIFWANKVSVKSVPKCWWVKVMAFEKKNTLKQIFHFRGLGSCCFKNQIHLNTIPFCQKPHVLGWNLQVGPAWLGHRLMWVSCWLVRPIQLGTAGLHEAEFHLFPQWVIA